MTDSPTPASGGDPGQSLTKGEGTGGVPPWQAAADEDDFQQALQGLAQLQTGGPLELALTRIATLAAEAVPGAEGAGLTMLELGRPQTVVTSAPFVKQIDDIQYGVGQGPCISAASEARTVISGSLSTDGTWPRFGAGVAHLGVNSALSLPLMIGDDVLGALNIYAHPHDVFGAHAAQLAEMFAIPAAVAVLNARTLMQAQRLAGQLQEALVNRAVIDQAIGILISRQGGDADEAIASLRAMSQNGNEKLSKVARIIVAEAARRARGRRNDRDQHRPGSA